MSYSTLMVQLDLQQSNDNRLRVAADLAEMFDARVVGISAADIRPLYFLDGSAAEELLEKDRAWLTAEMANCEQQFRQTFRTRADRIEWRSALDRPTDFVAREARAADLVITASLHGSADLMRQVDPGELVLRAGRPVLAVPPGLERLKTESIVVAWKDTREARRAVCDALPLLHKADEVVVVELVESGTDQTAAEARVKDVAGWLVRRGINASSITTKTLIGVPDQLVIIAQDQDANVIVAGAYGHTRIQEWAFGGVTRELLMQQKCYALLSQ